MASKVQSENDVSSFRLVQKVLIFLFEVCILKRLPLHGTSVFLTESCSFRFYTSSIDYKSNVLIIRKNTN